MKRRRDLLFLVGAAALTPRTLRAQGKQPVLIGYLSLQSRESAGHLLAALKEGLAALDWKDGSQIVIDARWAAGRLEHFPSLARDLASKRPAVLVVSGSRATVEAAKEAPGIPIVMVAGGDPVAGGMVSTLARPGGMVTGITGVTTDLSEKYLELLLAATPKLRRVGFLAYSHNPNRVKVAEAARRSAAQRSVEAHLAEVASSDEIEPALSRLAKEGAQALVVLPGALLIVELQRIIKLALAQRWPVIGDRSEYAEAGGLLGYGANRAAMFRRAAYHVDRILKGAKPGDLPVEQPTVFELVINMKTAKALRITIPQSILVRADRVIE